MGMEADQDMAFSYAPSVLTLTPILSRPRFRLLTCFVEPNRPVKSNKLLSVTLRKCRSSRDEAVVLRLKPIDRVLIVALVGSAFAGINHDIQIFQLQKSVEFRDKLLSGMQQKLDDLCEQMNQPEAVADSALGKNVDSDGFGTDESKFVDCGCCLCDRHRGVPISMLDVSTVNISSDDEGIQHMMPTSCKVEPEERRMSDLSDWASSVTSCADVQQVSSFLAEQDSCNLKSECEEKDLVIKELGILLHSSDATTKKRIAELEDLIQRKTTIITKLRKDMLVLEQKAVQLTRVSRPSSAYSPSSVQRPVLKDNLLYNMVDSTRSPSSSDSDSSPAYQSRALVTTSQESSGTSSKSQKLVASSSSSSRKANKHKRNTRPSSQLKENVIRSKV